MPYDMFSFFRKRILNYLKSQPLLKRLLSGAFYTVMATAITRIFSLLTNIGVARILGTEEFGVYGFFFTTFETFSVFSGMAFGFAVIKYTAEYRRRDPLAAGQYIGAAKTGAYISATLIAIILFVGSDKISIWMFNRQGLENLIQLGALYLFIRTINNIQIGSLMGFEAFREIAKVNALTGILDPLLTIPLVYYHGIAGGVYTLLMTSIIAYFYYFSVFKRKCAESHIFVQTFNREVFKKLPAVLSFSIPAFLSNIMLMPITWITNAILVSRPEGYSELGLFNAANQWRQFIVLMPTLVSTVMLAIAADSYAEKDKKNFRQSYVMNLKIAWIFALPTVVTVIMLGGFLNGFFGSKYEAASSLIPLLIITAFFSVINSAGSPAVTGAGRMWAEVGINVVWATTLLTFSFVLVPDFGANGLAYATLIAGLSQVAVRLIYIERSLVSGSLKELFPLILLSILLFVLLIGLTETKTFNLFWGVVLTVAGALPFIKKVRNIWCFESANVSAEKNESLD